MSHTYKYKVFKRNKEAKEQKRVKKEKHQETPNQQRKSLVAGEIYDRLLAAEIDSLSKLIRNGVFAFFRFVPCFLYLKVLHRVT